MSAPLTPPPPDAPMHATLAYAARLQIADALDQIDENGSARQGTWNAIFRLLDLAIEAMPPTKRLGRDRG